MFVATSFEPKDQSAVDRFKSAIEAGGFHPIIEKAGSPDSPPKKVRESIMDSDCMILVAFRRDELKKRGWATSAWIANEAGMAWAYGKPILAFVEEGVKDIGMLKGLASYTTFERAKLGSADQNDSIHQALVALKEKIGPSSQVEQLELIEQVLTPMGKGLIGKLSEQGNLYPTDDDSKFYEVAESIVDKSEMVRFATKTPVLLLQDESSTALRRKYRDTLLERLKESPFEARYMFSFPRTMAQLESYATRGAAEKESAVNTLRSVQHAIDAGTLDLRAASGDDFVSCIIGKSEMAYLWKSPQEGQSIATIYESRPLFVEKFAGFFDKVFTSSKRVKSPEIDQWVDMVSAPSSA